MATMLSFPYLKLATDPGLENDGSGGMRIKVSSGLSRSASGIALDTDASPSFASLTLSQSTGTAPLTVSSTTVVSNLNADLWDGHQFSDYLNQDLKTTSAPSFAGLTISGTNYLNTYQTGLIDVASSKYLYLGIVHSSLTADRNLFLDVGDAQRTITLSGSPTLSDWFNQDVKSTASPTHVRLTLSQTTGTAPFTISSTTVCTNLNADLWDGYQFSDYINQAVKTGSAVQHATIGLGAVLISGATLSMGDTASSAIATPLTLNMGGTYANSAGDPSKMKLRLYDDTTLRIGLSVSIGALEFFVSSNFDWFVNSGVSAVKIGTLDWNNTTNMSRLFVYGMNGYSAALYLNATTTGGAVNGDSWRMVSTVTATGELRFQNNTSGTYVSKLVLTTAGNGAFSGTVTGTQLISTSSAGTAPLSVSSSTAVTNLNADLWDGYQFSDYLNQAVKSTSSPTHVRLTLSQATGTAPFTISSTTVVSNLNSDYLDGLHSTSFARVDAASTVNGGVLSCYNPDGYTIDNVNGGRARLEVFQATANTDAFMAFHVSGDFACYFGVDGSTNALSVGGWSMGANVYRIVHEGLTNATLPGTLSVATDIYKTAWTDYSSSSTVSGWSTPTAYIYYKLIGKLCVCWFQINGTSTENSGSFTLPVTNRAVSAANLNLMRVQDNTAYSADPGWCAIASGASTVTLHKSLTANNGFTASGTKTVWGQITFETA